MKLVELQVDRLVGPTHHFGGLGVGNIASQDSAGNVSNPAAAAIQGLDKMRLVAQLGVPQLLLPPQPRPDIEFLRNLGFAGTDRDVLKRVFDEDPVLFSAAASCSAMWTANAATITPGIDRGHDKTKITIANLDASLHRAIEPAQTEAEFRSLFSDVCDIQAPLSGGAAMRDEGAANHMRLAVGVDQPGINLFVYGDRDPTPKIHWPRQTLAACEAIARLHQLSGENTCCWKQHPDAIDSGAFHNDVVAISHHGLLIHHQRAFDEPETTYRDLESSFERLTGVELMRIEVSEQELSLADAVRTYLFNSQVVSVPGSDQPVIICTNQVESDPRARALVDQWCGAGVFSDVRYVDLAQSMSGGGGPACLRLRLPMSQNDTRTRIRGRWTETLDQQVRELIQREYPSRLELADLARGDFHQHALRTAAEIQELIDRT